MGAYMVEIKVICDATLCGSRAVVRVFNTFNAAQGQFCRRHGAGRVKELQRGEAAAVRAVVAERDRDRR